MKFKRLFTWFLLREDSQADSDTLAVRRGWRSRIVGSMGRRVQTIGGDGARRETVGSAGRRSLVYGREE